MDPNKIKLEKLSKEFEYHKIKNEIDSCECIETVKNIAKSYAKLYLKQQEVVSGLGLQGI
jgi:hypothetical protein